MVSFRGVKCMNGGMGLEINFPIILAPLGCFFLARPTSSFVAAGSLSFALDVWNPDSGTEEMLEFCGENRQKIHTFNGDTMGYQGDYRYSVCEFQNIDEP